NAGRGVVGGSPGTHFVLVAGDVVAVGGGGAVVTLGQGAKVVLGTVDLVVVGGGYSAEIIGLDIDGIAVAVEVIGISLGGKCTASQGALDMIGLTGGIVADNVRASGIIVKHIAIAEHGIP